MRLSIKGKNMKKAIDLFLDRTLYIKDIKCLFCGCELDKDSRYCTCDDCLQRLPFLTGKVCKHCGEPIESMAEYCMRCKNHVDRGFDIARSVFLYRGVIAKAVKDLKYFGKKYYAEYLSKFLLDLYIREGFDCDVVISAPMSKKSFKSRGFNQAELLCKSFEDRGIKVDADCVHKVVETENQVNLNYKDRQSNLVGAFKVTNKEAVKNKRVLIVDDIFTTGATCSEIAETLKKAGASEVCVITLCHEMPEGKTN